MKRSGEGLKKALLLCQEGDGLMTSPTKLSQEYYQPWGGRFPHPTLSKEEKKKERWEQIKEAKENQMRLFDDQSQDKK